MEEYALMSRHSSQTAGISILLANFFFNTIIKMLLAYEGEIMINSVVLVGRAGQDPDMKYFESGKVKTTFSIAVNRWDSKSREEVTDWFNIELWDKSAEVAGEYVKKGKLVAIEGKLATSKWKDNTGADRERFFIRATNLRLLGSRDS